ncbi:alcohol dehydrogenase catalytic domain-containing protein [Chitinophaga horti]|uniref:Alcohol dehydrogenase catalytic domain-containing protein n=1 Tax=Chitinophaga horti TaxID=2920382 RepID=A0ABY6J0F4_9BACT|nr:alcohol dehydrogenase catalytic domain-containing protein [Chitinophaga horti]UYQ91799.1 alcohol dehydrogenase catalytic domain-containing protein [Chitinophaga horti]
MEQTMKAALKTEEGTFEVTDVDIPEIPGDDWVLARIRVAGICGTDLRHWKKKEPELVHEIMGHEMAGEVVKIGSAVKHVKPGDRVVIETVLGDGDCDWCRVQQYNLCPNLYKVRMKTVSRAFASYVTGPATKFHKLPDHVSFEEATVLDTFSVCMHAMQLSGIRINDTVVIIGAGPIGLGQLQLAKVAGATVIITDVVDSSLELATSLGADLVINTKKENGEDSIRRFTHGRGADITFECAGGPSMPETLKQAVLYTRIGGKIVIVGGFDPGDIAIPLPWQHIQIAEIQLIPSASYSFWGIDSEMRMCLDLLAKGRINAKKMITHSFSIDDINEAFETAMDKEKTGAVFVALTI